MKKLLILSVSILFLYTTAQSQNDKYYNISVLTTQNAVPFGKFAGMFKETLHPGIEAGWGKQFGTKPRHHWFAELRIAYFFHRFVQHGIPVYLNVGYSYKLTDHFSVETSIGAGYMHSIPASPKLKLDGDGNYKNDKGVGRMQGMGNLNIGTSYLINPSSSKPVKLFAAYQQRVQFPFVKSYVPLLPYNTMVLGVRLPAKK